MFLDLTDDERREPYRLNAHELGRLRISDVDNPAVVERIVAYVGRDFEDVRSLFAGTARHALVCRTLGDWAPRGLGPLTVEEAGRDLGSLVDALEVDTANVEGILAAFRRNTGLGRALTQAIAVARVGQWTAARAWDALAEDARLVGDISELLDLTERTVRRRIQHASGRMLIRNVFEAWPEYALFDPAPSAPARAQYERAFFAAEPAYDAAQEETDDDEGELDWNDLELSEDSTEDETDDLGPDDEAEDRPELGHSYGARELCDYLVSRAPEEIRDRRFVLSPDADPPPPLYHHQHETLDRVQQGATAAPPVSGIVHLPTGAGKTRIGIDLIRRELANDRDHLYLWATQRKALLHQTMMRFAGDSHGFPEASRIAWYHQDHSLLEDPPEVLLMTQRRLTRTLDQASRRKNDPLLRRLMEERRPVTLIYDECHQLGAQGLQKAWHRFVRRWEKEQRPPPRWRTVGLSATPLPTNSKQQRMYEEVIFPKRNGFAAANVTWPVHVFHQVAKEGLVRDGVLCPVNAAWDDAGVFDLPAELLQGVIGRVGLRPPGPNATRQEVVEYSQTFNREVMCDAGILEFLAARLAKHLPSLGKTIVFVPRIEAANRLVAELHKHESLRGKVAAVHSKIDSLVLPPGWGGDEGSPPSTSDVLRRFRELESEPSILVNVDMLTEGFDDPKIQTVVLARLTLSTNRFWQMVGRGTRGPKAQGTHDCYVIDPIKLMRLYNYFDGYQPSLRKRGYGAIADDEGEEALEPQVEVVCTPPLPTEVSEHARQVLADAGEALITFLRGDDITEAQLIEAATKTRVEVSRESVQAIAAENPEARPIPETATMLIFERIRRLEAEKGVMLSWLMRRLPSDLSHAPSVQNAYRRVDAVAALRLFTEPAYDAAEVEGRLAPYLAGEPPKPRQAREVEANAPQLLRSPCAQGLIDVCLALARADHRVLDAEIEKTAAILQQTLGLTVDEHVRRELEQAADLPATLESLPLVARELLPAMHPGVIMGLVELASVDNVITRNEIAMLRDIAAHFERGSETLEPWLEMHRLRPGVEFDVADPEPPRPDVCGSCEAALPAEAKFCMQCGARVAGS